MSLVVFIIFFFCSLPFTAFCFLKMWHKLSLKVDGLFSPCLVKCPFADTREKFEGHCTAYKVQKNHLRKAHNAGRCKLTVQFSVKLSLGLSLKMKENIEKGKCESTKLRKTIMKTYCWNSSSRREHVLRPLCAQTSLAFTLSLSNFPICSYA